MRSANALLLSSEEDLVEPRRVPAATRSDGCAYPGDLLADIIEYRALRTQVLLHRELGMVEKRRLEELEAHMRQPRKFEAEGPDLRSFYRFELGLDATLRYCGGNVGALSRVLVEDISAGGVRLVSETCVEEGELVSLLLERRFYGERERVVLPSRVVWSGTRALGLMFAGAPIRQLECHLPKSVEVQQ